MADLMTLTCPSCGGQLQVTNEADRFVCAHCGNSHVVDPGVRVESLAAEVEKLRDESRIRMIAQELSELEKQRSSLRAEISELKVNAALAGCIFRAGVPAAFLGALILTAIAVSELFSRYSGRVADFLGAAAMVAILGVIATRLYPTAKTVFNRDPQLQKLVTVERQIIQHQRELDTLQYQVNQSYIVDSISADTHLASRIPTT